MSRYPVEASAVGLVQNDKQKLYMFSILWSDCNNILIYRTYDSFKDVAKLLARKFPLEAGVVNKAERILPILKDAPLLFRSKFSNRYLERLRLLEAYSKELLQIDSKISQCQEVIQFFSPDKQDLNPSFPDNSIVITPSENDQKQKDITDPPRSPQPTTTQPIISETYICIDEFETKDTKNKSFKVQKNQSIGVLIKDPSGWWLVENEERCVAWFPAPYLRKADNLNDNSRRKSFYKGTYYYAEKGYEAQQADEISLTMGVVVEVIERSETGWWLICYNGRFGYVPAMFLKPYKNPHQKLQTTLDHTLSGSSPNLSKLDSNLDTGSNPHETTNRVRVHKGRLERIKSISMNGINNLSDASEQTFVKTSRQRNFYVNWETQDAKDPTSASMTGNQTVVQVEVYHHDCVGKSDHVEEKLRKDSGFEEHLSPKTLVSLDDGDYIPPPVPQRPTLQEIQARCTTITKKAVQQGRV
ncbi:hypothetical protein GDO81_016621 [Engystomops pustulosus]|uniref:NADPH oxidase organizer 1 n=1 Tax=Engystomops pustulosus TaxID=76066 RepID=A0AAV7AH44_ENGPU|nr:hypothetical protein GDO81_016621 [Engystomops pustulosus]